jgi:hypothetical protein
LRVPRRQGDAAGALAVEADLEGILSRAGERNVEDQDRPGLDVHHPCGWLAELHGAFPAQELVSRVIHEANADGVYADLGAPAAYPKYEVGSGVHRREVRQPHVLKHAEHAELALLVDQGVVGNDGEIEVQSSVDSN